VKRPGGSYPPSPGLRYHKASTWFAGRLLRPSPNRHQSRQSLRYMKLEGAMKTVNPARKRRSRAIFTIVVLLSFSPVQAIRAQDRPPVPPPARNQIPSDVAAPTVPPPPGPKGSRRVGPSTGTIRLPAPGLAPPRSIQIPLTGRTPEQAPPREIHLPPPGPGPTIQGNIPPGRGGGSVFPPDPEEAR
jgi:hypothetical protein